MNPAQAYGAALTYARRYTVQLVQAIACDDDDALEAHTEEDRKNFAKANYGIDFDEIKKSIDSISNMGSLTAYYREILSKKPSQKQIEALNKIFVTAKERINGKQK